MKRFSFIALVTAMQLVSVGTARSYSDYGSYLVSSYALAIGDIPAASVYLDDFMTGQPENMAMLRRAYVILAMAGDIKRAAYYAEKDNGNDRMRVADFIIAVDNVREGDYAGARKYLKAFAAKNDAIAILSCFPEAWFWVGEKEYGKALDVLQKAKSEPDLRGMYHLHTAMIQELAGEEKQAVDNYEKALSAADRLSPRGMMVAAKVLRRHGREEVVVKALDKLMEDRVSTFIHDYRAYILDDDSPSPLKGVDDGLSEAFYGMASLFFQARSSEVAEIMYSFSLAFSPDFYSLKLMFGELYEEAGDVSRAESIYGEFRLDTPFGLTALSKKAKMMAKRGEASRAQEALRFMALSRPDVVSLTIDYADFLREQKQFGLAAIYYSKAMERFADADGKLDVKFWFLVYCRAISYERFGLWDSAEKDFLTALEMSPDNPHILNYLGYSWLVKGVNKDKALAMIEKASRKMPFDGHITDSLGWAYYLSGSYSKAEEVLERALDIVSDNSVILDHLGDAYWKVGRRLEAEFQWKKALQMDRDLEPGDYAKIKYKIEYGLDDFEKNYGN